MKTLLLFILFYFCMFFSLISQTEKQGPTKFIFERNDGSVFEKMKGSENFVEINPGRENELITSRLVKNHQKIIVRKMNGKEIYSYNFKEWYNNEDNSQTESSHLLKELNNFFIKS